MMTTDDITLAVTLGGIFVLCSTFPQVIQTLRTRKTRDINLFLTIFAIGGLAFYVYYAIRTSQWIFAIADGIDMNMWAVVLTIKLNNVVKKREIPEKEIVYKSEYCRKNGHIHMRKFSRCLICDEEK